MIMKVNNVDWSIKMKKKIKRNVMSKRCPIGSFK
jgi:hypothetical protein